MGNDGAYLAQNSEDSIGLKQNQLLDTLAQHVFNNLPTHLIRTSDLTLLSRSDVWEDVRAHIQGSSNIDTVDLHSTKEAILRTQVKYAILSHRWGAHEPTYQLIARNKEWMSHSSAQNDPGVVKLLRFCEMARVYDCPYAWSDTCCIDKSSSAELEEAIRAMYTWYRDAEVCIAHLAMTDTLQDFEREPWFERGWTLQELLAPKRIVFYNRDWEPISAHNACSAELRNDKKDWRILGSLSKVAGVPVGDLRHFRPGCERVAEKMRWASRRKTTRTEDVAYALLGIFDITMPISYGEGRWAFYRLTEGIAQRCSEPGFFAWAGDASHYSFAFPYSPSSYGMPVLDGPTVVALRLAGAVFEEVGDRSYSITKLGLQVRLLLLPVRWVLHHPGHYTLSFAEGTFLESKSTPTLSQAYHEIFQPDQCVLGVVNYTRIEGDRGLLRMGEQYFSLLLKSYGASSYIKARTDHVLVWRCIKDTTKDLANVCLLNTLGSYGRDTIS